MSWDDTPACPPSAKVSILLGLKGDDPTYLRASPRGVSNSRLSKARTNSGLPDCISDINLPKSAPSLMSPSLPE